MEANIPVPGLPLEADSMGCDWYDPWFPTERFKPCNKHNKMQNLDKKERTNKMMKSTIFPRGFSFTPKTELLWRVGNLGATLRSETTQTS